MGLDNMASTEFYLALPGHPDVSDPADRGADQILGFLHIGLFCRGVAVVVCVDEPHTFEV